MNSASSSDMSREVSLAVRAYEASLRCLSFSMSRRPSCEEEGTCTVWCEQEEEEEQHIRRKLRRKTKAQQEGRRKRLVR